MSFSAQLTSTFFLLFLEYVVWFWSFKLSPMIYEGFYILFFFKDQDLSYMAHCLRRVNATKMVNAEWDGIVYGIMGIPFAPVHDGDFFPDSPATALARENFKKTKILLGEILDSNV